MENCRDDLKDVPLHRMVVKEVKDENGLISFSAVLRMSETESIVVRGDTEDKALRELRRLYNDWMDEPSR